MTTPQITIYDAVTGETVTRNFNDAELAQLEKDKAEEKKQADALAAKQAARQTVLDRLGLTEQEAQLLLGS